jgi:hypothetical protein
MSARPELEVALEVERRLASLLVGSPALSELPIAPLLAAPPEEADMRLEAVGVTQPEKHGPFQIRLKFGKQTYCVIEVGPGEDSAEAPNKLRELADQIERLKA